MDGIVISEKTELESDVVTLGPMDVRAILTLIYDGGKVTLRFTSLDAIERVESAMRALYYESLFVYETSLEEEGARFHGNRMRDGRARVFMDK